MDYEKIILLIVGAFIGFVLSVAKDFLMENKKQKEKHKQLKREKLEEIFVLVDKLNQNAIKSLEYIENIETARLSLLIRFYFPQFNDNYKKFAEEYIKIGQLKLEQKEYLPEYVNKLSVSTQKLLNLMVEESKKYNS